VISGIAKSRAYFENLPDKGLFGKNLTRIINLIENYVFRLLFVGIIIILILKPILIIVNVIASLILTITAFLWIPIIILFRNLFCFLIFDFDNEC
jgi:hypothetical protein